ncbi:MAG: protein translocase subunit SecF [bacterium]|nr:protein translocase subunit SecF [bacterium]
MLIKHRKTFYIFSATLLVLAVLSLVVFGLNLGIDFTGGALLSVEYETAPTVDQVRGALNELKLSSFTAQKSGEQGFLIRTQDVSEENHQNIIKALSALGELKPDQEKFESIGSSIGQELKDKTRVVIILSLLCILVYVAFAFRKISKPVQSYVYGITGLLALCHDVLIPLGILAFLGHYFPVEINIPIITAFLTVFGYSINDSVVVFDRVRENLLKSKTTDFEAIIDQSIKQSATRSLNTALTTIIALFCILILGGETLRWFSLALILGIGFGTYSSLFLATPLVLTYEKFRKKSPTTFVDTH